MVDSTAALNNHMEALISTIMDLHIAVIENSRLVAENSHLLAENSHLVLLQGELLRQQGQATQASAPMVDMMASLSVSPPGPQPSQAASEAALANDIEDLSPEQIRHILAGQGGSTQGAWYVVTVGEQPGVYRDIAEVAHLTSGISGNAYKRYASQQLALQVYDRAWALGAIKRVH